MPFEDVMKISRVLSGIVVASAIALGAVATTRGQTRPSDAVVPFKIQVPDAVLRDLKERLARTRFPEELPGAAWDYGTDLDYLKELVAYWRDRFDWRAQERRLNQFDQFTTKIDGLTSTSSTSGRRSRTPCRCVLTHGWPGSIVEFNKVIGPLTDPVKYGGRAADAFHVVALSLPGFGFSGKPRDRGYSPDESADIIAKLMARLGYTRYGRRAGTGAASSAASRPSRTRRTSPDCT